MAQHLAFEEIDLLREDQKRNRLRLRSFVTDTLPVVLESYIEAGKVPMLLGNTGVILVQDGTASEGLLAKVQQENGIFQEQTLSSLEMEDCFTRKEQDRYELVLFLLPH